MLIIVPTLRVVTALAFIWGTDFPDGGGLKIADAGKPDCYGSVFAPVGVSLLAMAVDLSHRG
jgi:hypothetical protein